LDGVGGNPKVFWFEGVGGKAPYLSKFNSRKLLFPNAIEFLTENYDILRSV
jgi:hypothetical protein